jgi:EF-P beta-lysylation protein EpmB
VPGLLHKYQNRALLITTGACAVHCRYCFRRHYPYSEGHSGGAQLPAALAYLERETDIEEVILSGGDPLMLDDEKIAALLTALEAIPHLKRVRLHSRTPVVLPQRITEALADRLAASRLQAVLVVHVNHAQELRAGLPERLPALRAAGVTLLNQAVLLRGVNDSLAALTALSDGLFAAGILPYYLHLLDPVAGAGHFAVEEGEAFALYQALCEARSGYLVPKLTREIPGRAGKQSYAPTLGPGLRG